MSVTIRWLLEQDSLDLRIRGGNRRLDTEIANAHASELLEPFPWMAGGELLLTTGLRLPDGRADRFSYVRKLAESGAAGIGFGTGLSFDTIPQDLVDASNTIGLPLLEVPLPTPFAAVTKKIATRTAEIQFESMFRVWRAQPRMTRAAINGGTSAITRELADALTSTVLLVDRSGKVVKSHPNEPEPDVVAKLQSLTTGGGATPSRVGASANGTPISLQRIATSSTVHGFVAAVGRTLTDIDHILMGHAASLLALDFDSATRFDLDRQRLNSLALDLLLAESDGVEPVRSLVGESVGNGGPVQVLSLLAETSDRAERAAAAVAKHFTRVGLQLFHSVHAERVTVLMSRTENRGQVLEVVRAVNDSDRKHLRIGLSSPYAIAQFRHAVEESRLAAASAKAGAEPVEFGVMVGGVLLADSTTRHMLSAVGNATLAPLEEHDRANRTALIASLRAFLEANGHWESAAAALGVHRHTLRNRLARIENITHCDLDNARVRAELLLAMIARSSHPSSSSAATASAVR
ncbi:PucR family transcriptional regulator [Rhodococcoides kroppenstedtii]|uniref:PucR family transcriptional regulator n=1 Tax=Rhodococcoides kroppenstedtii TaxID=293050 RepID=UPI0028EBFCB1|nr:PucR family transcriptional regulator [Rhodococcus kroppenstedtii]